MSLLFFLIILEFESLSVYVFMFWSFWFSVCDLHVHLSLWCSPQYYWFLSTLYIYSERLNPTTLTGRGYLPASGPHFSFRTRLLICLLFVKLRMGKAINYNYLWMFPGQINQPNTCSAWRELSHIGTHTWRDFIKLTVRKNSSIATSERVNFLIASTDQAMFNIYSRIGLWEFMLLFF